MGKTETLTEEYKKYFLVLELSPKASLPEIRISYQRLKALYSGDSIVMSALMEDFSDEHRQNILAQIEEAYTKLNDFLRGVDKDDESKTRGKKSVVFNDGLKKYISGISSFNGSVLREIRVRLGIELNDISAFTRIRKQYFEDIELERFSAFSSEVYLKGYVLAYAHYLSLDPTTVANDYMARYRIWKTANNGTNNGRTDPAQRSQENQAVS